MRLIKGFRGRLLLKGDGNHGIHPVTGEIFYYGNHPEELMWGNHEGSHENGFDRPKFSHYGNLGIPKGQWGKGVHGEHVWRDEFGIDHMHGIDGVIRKVGNMLESYGKQQSPKAAVQEAIYRYNVERAKRGDTGHLLPDVDSPEWRQLRYGDFQAGKNKEEALRMRTHGTHGSVEEGTIQHDRLATVFTNSHEHPVLGRFGETYSIPFAHFLKDVLMESGLQLGKYDEGLTHHYIGVDDLSVNPETGVPVGSRKRGGAGKQLGPSGEMSDEWMKRMNVNQPDMAVGEVHPWQVLHHLPDIFYRKGGGGRPTNTAQFAKTLLSLDQSKMPPELLETPILQDEGGVVTLRDALSNETYANAAVRKLAQTPAILHLLMGDASQGITGQVVNFLKDSIQTPEDAMDYNQFRTHVKAGEITTDYQRSRGKRSQEAAADLFAFANLMGEDPENPGVSNLKNAIEHDYNLHEDVEGQENLAIAFANALSYHHGHEPQRGVLSAEEMPSTAHAGRMSSGVARQDFPQHVQDYYIHTHNPVASKQTAPVPPDTANTVKEKMREYNERAAAERAARVADKTTPPPPPREEAQLAEPPPQLPAQTSAQPSAPIQQPTQPSDAELMAARRAFQYATPQQARRVYVARTGLGQEGRAAPDFTSPEAQQRLAAFQSAIADPYQQTLTPFMKSEDAQNRLIKAMENIQMKAANLNPDVKKLLPSSPLNMNKEEDISYMAQKMGIAKNDIRTILLSKGDWQRVSNTFDINPVIVKAVKLAFRSDSNE